jgi:hypothetical protein
MYCFIYFKEVDKTKIHIRLKQIEDEYIFIKLEKSSPLQQLPVLSGRIRPEIIGINQGNSQPEYCFYVPGISRVFLQDPVTFPHLSRKILQDPVAGTIDLGMTKKNQILIN